MKNKPNKGNATIPIVEVVMLLEDLRNQFKVFIEKLSAISDKLDMLYKIIKADPAEIKGHEKRIAHLETVVK